MYDIFSKINNKSKVNNGHTLTHKMKYNSAYQDSSVDWILQQKNLFSISKHLYPNMVKRSVHRNW